MYSWTVIGWTYEANLHCTDCARDRFGARALYDGTAEDSDGNPPHPVFAGDEMDPLGEYCGTCGAEISEPYTDDYYDEDDDDYDDDYNL
jgi:hypothetical protein